MHALATLYPWKAARPPARPDSQADQQRPRMCVHVHVGIARQTIDSVPETDLSDELG